MTIKKIILILISLAMLLAGKLPAGTVVLLQTPVGNIYVDLYDHDKPVTVSNFLNYVRSGAYNNSFIHRSVPQFVLQAGGYTAQPNATVPTVTSIPSYGTIPCEAGVGPFYSNTNGTLAMALVGSDTNSATSQFFINLGNNSFLDGTVDGGPFTVFGRVIGAGDTSFDPSLRNGMNVVNAIAALPIVNDALENIALATLPVLNGSNGALVASEPFSNLVTYNASIYAGTNRPTLSITNLPAGIHVSNQMFTVAGRTTDPIAVTNVFVSLDGINWTRANSLNNFTNWTALVALSPGTNTVFAYAVDVNGSVSLTNSAKLVYILNAQLTVSANGHGLILPNYNNAFLPIGNNYSMTATPANGFAFTNWTDGSGNTLTNRPTFKFTMALGLELIANFVDVQKPTLSITNIPLITKVSNDTFTLRGKAGDNVGVVNVFYKLNDLGWSNNVLSGNSFTNWSADLTLVPGPNAIAVYAQDAAGNNSLTNTAQLTYILSALLTVNTNGRGTIAPNYNNAYLQISNRYTLTAIPAIGFSFTNWTDGAGNVVTNRSVLSFLMASNLAFTANFVDVQKPTITITNLPVGGKVSNAVFTVRGRAGDNVGVTNVFFNLNNGGWTNGVNTGNNFTNWSVDLPLSVGTNYLYFYAQDAAGNVSATNAAKVFYVVSAQVNVQIVGNGTLTPNYNGQSLALGNNYGMRAAAAAGFAFSYWGGDVPMTTNAALIFNLASNETIIANFVDITRPVNTVTFPVANQRLTNTLITATGKAGDNVGVAMVWVQVNAGGWMPAATANGFTNWIATNLLINLGTNLLQAYAQDAAGNISPTNSVKFIGAISSAVVYSADGMSLIPAGTFNMGNSIGDADITDANPTSIYVSAFHMDTNLVSYARWQAVYDWATNNGYVITHAGEAVAADYPVTFVDRADCLLWCNARSQQAGLTPVYYTDAGFTQVLTNWGNNLQAYANWSANGYRLPTEAEWEKAARGGAIGLRFPWGNTISWSQANYEGAPGSKGGFTYDLSTTVGYDPAYGGGTGSTSPVGHFAANGYGLYDMAGNAFEICWDFYGTPYGQPTTNNPTGPTTGIEYVLRGGSWASEANAARCANRFPGDGPEQDTGFRSVRGN